MTRNEIIEALKKNEREFFFLTDEQKIVALQIGKKNFLFHEDGGKFSVPNSSYGFIDATMYRLRPDYQPEPEKPKMGWVEYPVNTVGNDERYAFSVGGLEKRMDQTAIPLQNAFGMVGFGGIKFRCCSHFSTEDGNLSDWLTDIPSPCDECGPHIPIAVRFWEAKK